MSSPTPAPSGWASLKLLSPYQWFVFIVCCAAWSTDCMDQQLFVLARRPAMTALVPKVKADDPRVPEFRDKLTRRAEIDLGQAQKEQQVAEEEMKTVGPETFAVINAKLETALARVQVASKP